MTKKLNENPESVNSLNDFKLLIFGDLKKFVYKYLLLCPKIKVENYEFSKK